MDETEHPQAVEYTTPLSEKLHVATKGRDHSLNQANQAVKQIMAAAGAIKALEEQVLVLREEKGRMQDLIEAASAAYIALKLETEAARILAAASKEANFGSTSSRGDSKGETTVAHLISVMRKLKQAKRKMKELSASLALSESRFADLKTKSENQLRKIDSMANGIVASTVYDFWNYVGKRAFIKGNPTPLIQAFLASDAGSFLG
ncbi:hypothetical protein Ae201684_003541 [Aphanomyces euteiches]|uniref:Uncharacterized protein n=1 Tax=Aphanomyces euteiches TaxID=100861 RepID=A0A6G0XLJ1_9STRA|nr:hypothetical protein Ae201684_003541 [Aphanomyces euteiches]